MENISKQIDKNKKYSIQLILVCFFVYLFSQITKNALNANVNSIMSDYGVLESDAGIATSVFHLCYGIGQIINAFFCLKYNKKIVISISLFLSFASTLLLSFNIPFFLIKYLSAINGLAHSTLWLLLLLKLNQTLDKKYMPKAAIFMSLASTFGQFLSFGVCSLFSGLNYYKGSFLTAAIFVFASLCIWIIYNIKEPKIEKEESLESNVSEKQEKRKLKVSFIAILTVFSILSASAIGINGAIKSWAPAIIKKTYNFTDWLSILLSLILPLCNVFNTFFCSAIYKKLKDFNYICILFFIITSILMIPLIFFIDKSWIVGLSLFILIVISTGIIGNALTVHAPLLLAKGGLNSGLIAGLYNGFGYLGSFIVILILGFISEDKGWGAIFPFLLILSITSFAIALVYALIRHNVKKKRLAAQSNN